MCDKKGFGSKGAARRSVNQMHQTIRVYLCPSCHRYHVTKERNPERWNARNTKRRGA